MRIVTTDISGGRGYSASDVTRTFNGTSSATPHAAAALALSVKPPLSERRVREILNATCDRLRSGAGWNPLEGHGRLSVYAAVRQARRG